MAIRGDLSVNWEVSPRVITVAAPSVEITIQDLLDTCRHLESLPSAMDDDSLIDAAGKEFLGGTTYVGLTATLNNSVLAFEARPGPEWVLCSIAGGNLVAVDSNNQTIDARTPTAYTTIDRSASSSATITEVEAVSSGTLNEADYDAISDAVWEHSTGIATVSGINFIRAMEGGKWELIDNQMIFYEYDNITEVARFDLLNQYGLPSLIDIRSRIRV